MSPHLRCRRGGVRPAHQDTCPVGLDERGDDAHEGGLAGTVRAEQPHHFAGVDLQIHPA